MSRRIMRPRTNVCQLCKFVLTQEPYLTPLHRIPKVFNSSRSYTSTSRRKQESHSYANITPVNSSKVPSPTSRSKLQRTDITEAEFKNELQQTRATCNALLANHKVPTDKETLQVLNSCRSLAEAIAGEPVAQEDTKEDGTATSALLSLDDSHTSRRVQLQKLSREARRMVDELSELAYSIVKHPNVFFTPEVLAAYVAIQASLGKAETFGEVFHMYANKPVPKEGSSPVIFQESNPNKVSNAVPVKLADRALQTAIDSKQMIAAMDIVETAYATKAFRRAKFVRKGLLPTTGLAIAPFAAYSVASQLASFQQTMETGLARNLAFAGILAYFGFTTSIGLVAITTANDQMERVTWARGTPLRERWIREEERAAIDKIACSWGFKESWRRGEEEGEEWYNLREWIGNRDMILDAVELMEGME